MVNRVAKATTKTSATGNRCFRTGFTLIEIMVVMAIMGIMLAVTASIMGENREAYLLRQETMRLKDMLGMAADDAVLRGREWGVVLTPQDYRFVYFDSAAQQWANADIAALERYTLPDALSLTLEATNNLTLPGDAASPDILLLSSGQTSAFTLQLQAKSDPRQHEGFATDGHSNIVQVEDSDEKTP